MMSDIVDKMLFDAMEVDEYVDPPPPPEPVYIIRAYWSPGERWSVLNGNYPTVDGALAACQKMAKGWSNHQIWKIG